MDTDVSKSTVIYHSKYSISSSDHKIICTFVKCKLYAGTVHVHKLFFFIPAKKEVRLRGLRG